VPESEDEGASPGVCRRRRSAQATAELFEAPTGQAIVKLILVSDIHANLEALEAVLKDAAARCPGARVVCAGDLVGYGPDPEACIRRVQSGGIACVVGDHDEMVLGRRDFSRCVYAGIVAARWTRRTLSESALEFLDALPLHREVRPGTIMCHGDIYDADRYVDGGEDAERALGRLHARIPDARLQVCGHTHRAVIYSASLGFRDAAPETVFRLSAGVSHLVNPGAVGQSRDGRPLARYAVYDTVAETVSYHALAYDHRETLRKLHAAGLVPSVVYAPPRGTARYVEAVRKRRARLGRKLERF
jgi:predicted phosphodiesterase